MTTNPTFFRINIRPIPHDVGRRQRLRRGPIRRLQGVAAFVVSGEHDLPLLPPRRRRGGLPGAAGSGHHSLPLRSLESV